MQFTCVFDSPSRVSSRRNFISGNIACTVSASISSPDIKSLLIVRLLFFIIQHYGVFHHYLLAGR